MNISPDKIRKYFELRLPDRIMSKSSSAVVRCCFHDDRSPSLSINFDKGVWKCHTGCGGGGLIDFEMKFSSCDRDTAWSHIGELIGEKQMGLHREAPEATYRYCDGDGKLLFEKLRYPGKRFAQRRPTGAGGWDYKLGDVKKPLYRLPELLMADYIAVCEGEKDADNLQAAMKGIDLQGHRFCATTNFDGAGKWRDEYAPFFTGKKALILPDCDEIGRKHARMVAESVYPYSSGVKIVELPGLQDKQDVSDFLKTKSVSDLLAVVKNTQAWHPEKSKLLVPAQQFVATIPEQVDWLVEGVIERGANGFFCAVPKGGKSWCALDLAIALTSGGDWMGFRIPDPVNVAVVSREDNPALTGWRLRSLSKARGVRFDDVNLYVNTRQQSERLMLDCEQEMSELITALHQVKPQFVLFDVLNVLHGADENDNTEMRTVLSALTRIQTEAKCSVGVVHHFNKNDSGSMTQRLRGSSAIAGWAEWLVGISMADDELKIRKMEFELKAAQPPEPIYFQIMSDEAGARICNTTYTAPNSSWPNARKKQ